MNPDNPNPAPPPPTPVFPPPSKSSPSTPPPPPPVTSTDIPSYKSKPSRKKFVLLVLVLLLAIGTGGVLVSRQQATPTTTKSTPAPTAAENPQDELAGFTKGIEKGPNTVQVTKANGKFCLRYKDKIYLPQDNESISPKQAFPPDPEVYTWYGLVDAPSDLTNQDSELFSFKVSPDNNSFVFIMRWARSPEEQFAMYRFTSEGSAPIASFGLPSISGAYWVPRISQISAGGSYAALNMYNCLDCPQAEPETTIFDLTSKQSKKLGKITDFEWGESGKYTYKEAATQNLKTGQF